MFRVAEPMVVKTVSNKTESAEKFTFADESVIKVSFLQEENTTINTVKITLMAKAFFNKSNLIIITVFWREYCYEVRHY